MSSLYGAEGGKQTALPLYVDTLSLFTLMMMILVLLLVTRKRRSYDNGDDDDDVEITASDHYVRSKQLGSVAALLGFYLSSTKYIVLIIMVLVCSEGLMFLPCIMKFFILYYFILFSSILTCSSVMGPIGIV